METKVFFSFLVLVLFGFLSSCHAADFYVGNGWTLKPDMNLTKWASDRRFKIKDSLIFKYNKDLDSVLLVDQNHLQSCNSTEFVKKLDNNNGEAKFTFDKSGPFFFISGVVDNCKKGLNMTLRVMSEHHSPPAGSPPTVPSPLPKRGSPAPTPSPTPSPAPAPENSTQTKSAASPALISSIGFVAGASLLVALWI